MSLHINSDIPRVSDTQGGSCKTMSRPGLHREIPEEGQVYWPPRDAIDTPGRSETWSGLPPPLVYTTAQNIVCTNISYNFHCFNILVVLRLMDKSATTKWFDQKWFKSGTASSFSLYWFVMLVVLMMLVNFI